MSARPASVLALTLVLVAGACVDAEVTRVGPNRPSRGDGCAVEIVSEAPPPGAVVDVASGVVSCSGARARCLAELRKIA